MSHIYRKDFPYICPDASEIFFFTEKRSFAEVCAILISDRGYDETLFSQWREVTFKNDLVLIGR